MIDLQIKGLELHMNYNTFIASIKSGFPPAELTNPELAMWYAMNDNWNSAHQTAQSIKNELGAWIHAYLHRIEGDLENANYWYRHANRPPSQNTLKDEAEEIIRFITQI
tara:strand:- start:57 stop:383 length:327 start_codon:yes stop_codon:yes gene_type:complete